MDMSRTVMHIIRIEARFVGGRSPHLPHLNIYP